MLAVKLYAMLTSRVLTRCWDGQELNGFEVLREESSTGCRMSISERRELACSTVIERKR
jgi:hypothetical protein